MVLAKFMAPAAYQDVWHTKDSGQGDDSFKRDATYRNTFRLTECGVFNESPMEGWLRW